MIKNQKNLSKDTLKKVKTLALAEKHHCSDVYVRCVLSGTRRGNSHLAQLILKDANDIVSIFERDTDRLIKRRS